jgi:hypothetical protein
MKKQNKNTFHLNIKEGKRVKETSTFFLVSGGVVEC